MSDDIEALKAKQQELVEKKARAQEAAELRKQIQEQEREIAEIDGSAQDAVYRAYGRVGVGASQPPPPSNRQHELLGKLKGVGDGGGYRRSITRDEAAEYLHQRSQDVFSAMRANRMPAAGTRTIRGGE